MMGQRVPVTHNRKRQAHSVRVDSNRFTLNSRRAVAADAFHLNGVTETMENEMELVHTLANRFEADLLMDALEQENIPALLRSFEETPYDGLFVMQRGWGQILVPQTMAARAKGIIDPLIQTLRQKKLYDDPADVDPLLWEQLRQADPEIICRNAQVRYEQDHTAYVVPFLDGEFRCLIQEELIVPLGPNAHIKVNFQFCLAILHYLLESQSTGLVGKWTSEQEIPGGSLFFRGPHALPTKPLEELFGERLALFAAAAERLGGMRVASGDLAYRLWALPRIPMLFVLWKGDDEFPAAIQIRFDASIPQHLQALDTILALVHTVCRSLLSAGKAALAESEA